MSLHSNLPLPLPSGTRSENPYRAMAPIAAGLFFGFISVGLPLPVVPLFVHQVLGYGDAIVGGTIGLQFFATVLTRSYAGGVADAHGGKRSMMRGAAVCALAGVLYMLASALPLPPVTALIVLLAGRVLAGFGEGQLVTGSVTWIISMLFSRRMERRSSTVIRVIDEPGWRSIEGTIPRFFHFRWHSLA